MVARACLVFCALLFVFSTHARELREIRFAVVSDYYPFSFKDGDMIRGHDIDLARMIATELGMGAVLIQAEFGDIFHMVDAGIVDAAISAISITADRAQKWNFSRPYLSEGVVVVFNKEAAVKEISDLGNKKVACQRGTRMEQWLGMYVPNALPILCERSHDVAQTLLANNDINIAIFDASHGRSVPRSYDKLMYMVADDLDAGYGVMVGDNAILLERINRAIDVLESRGEIARLRHEWLIG